MQDPSVSPVQPESYSTTHIVHALMQFTLAVRHRINVLIAALVVCALLGGLYFATATRYYAAKAQLLVLQTGDDVTTSMTAQGGRQQSLMPTYEKLFTSAKVLEMAIAYLLPEDRIDFAESPKDRWVEILKRRLTAKAVFGSNIIEIEYRSKDPGAAVAVVNAVVYSYLKFMDKTHKGTAGEIIDLLTNEKDAMTQRLREQEMELQRIRAQLGMVGMGMNPQVVHPLVQRAVSFNEALITEQKQRISMEASLAAIQAAVQNGEDLRQHLLEVADAVGKEVMLSAIGLNPRDAANMAAMDQRLLENQTRLASLQEHCGPNHPEVVALRGEIRVTGQYLSGYQERVNQRLAELQDTQLRSMLVGMVTQRLQETRRREGLLQGMYEQAYAEANQLNDQFARLEMAEFDVKWLRDLHQTLLNKLADLDLRQKGPELRTTVVSEPVKDESPVSPRLGMTLAMLILGGTGMGLMLVYVLDALDDRFRSVEEMQSQLRAPVLAIVRTLQAKQAVGLEALQLYAQPNATESESFRTLRTALSLAERESRQIVVSSAEPGDGKTTILANLGVCYAQSAKKTLLIDADLRRPGLTALLGLRGVEGLSGIIRGEAHVAEMAATHIRASGIDGLDVLAAGPRPTNPAELLASVRFSELLAWAETVYDQILIDSPPALATSDTAVIGRLVDGVVLVVQPEKNRRRVVLRAAEGLSTLKIPLLGVVINRVRSGNDYSYDYGSAYGYGDQDGADRESHDNQDILSTEDAAPPTAPDETGKDQTPDRIVPRRVA